MVYPAFITILDRKLTKIDNSNLSYNDKTGYIGEAFIKDGIKYFLWERGFKVGKTGFKTFTIYGYNRYTRKHKGGVDFKLKIRYDKLYNFYIESKNWKKYRYITYQMFKDEILDRFTQNASQKGWIRVVTMNKRNKHLITTDCIKNSIHIIPLEEHITTRFINTINLDIIMEKFLDEFSKLFHKHISKKPHSFKYKSTSVKGKIKEDIILGKPYDYIAEKHKKSKGYIQKIASEMKSQDKEFIDRRSDEWDIMQYITDSG